MEIPLNQKTTDKEQENGESRIKEEKQKLAIWEGRYDNYREESPDNKEMRRVFHGHSLTGTVTRQTFPSECAGVLTNGNVAGITSGVSFVAINSLQSQQIQFSFQS